MKYLKKILNVADLAIEIYFFHMNMNGLVSHVDKTCSKRKHELTKIQRKKIKLINRLKYAEHTNFSIDKDVFKKFEGDDYDNIYEVLST